MPSPAHRQGASVAAYVMPSSPAGSETSVVSAQQLEGLPPPHVVWHVVSWLSPSFSPSIASVTHDLLRGKY